jgi:hypothetical protein
MTEISGTTPENSTVEESVSDVDSEWKQEIETHVNAYERGELELIPTKKFSSKQEGCVSDAASWDRGRPVPPGQNSRTRCISRQTHSGRDGRDLRGPRRRIRLLPLGAPTTPASTKMMTTGPDSARHGLARTIRD